MREASCELLGTRGSGSVCTIQDLSCQRFQIVRGIVDLHIFSLWISRTIPEFIKLVECHQSRSRRVVVGTCVRTKP